MHTVQPDRFVLSLDQIDRDRSASVGGKGAHLGELARIEGVRVPAGFCVTTEAFREVMASASLDDRLDRLAHLRPDDHEAIRVASGEIRQAIAAIAVPGEVAEAVTAALACLGDATACAVRSSATAEDLPTASFAGQQDTYLNVVGSAEILHHVSRCWASLFTERAVTYRLRHGFDQRQVQMAVVVQRMVFPTASGVLFTADPVTGNRKATSVEATFGLGEALVSGLVSPDTYQVRDGAITAKAVATKPLAVVASPSGGTRREAIEPERQARPALADEQVVELARLGRRIEAHLGRPQDVEWCLADDGFHVVQSRPITTLFPIPATDDGAPHVWVSVGHQQMMTDAMKPLGLSLFQLTAMRPMDEAGGRLFVDVTDGLASPSTRAGLLDILGGDPLIRDALETVLDRGDLISSLPEGDPGAPPLGAPPAGGPPAGGPPPSPPLAPSIEADPAIAAELIERNEASVAALRRAIEGTSGVGLLDLILDDVGELKRLLFEPRSNQVIMAAMEAAWWLNEHLEAWLGERNVADVLTRSVPHNITSEMGLDLLDVADAIRPHPEVVAFLEGVSGDDLLDGLAQVGGGPEARDAIAAYLDRYGMRGVGEIDITRPRWSEQPSALVPLILANVRDFEPGAHQRRFEQGRREAWEKERELLARLRELPDGERKADEAEQQIGLVRTFAGYREYPKYGIVCRYLIYKRALLEEAERLVDAGVLREAEDIFHLRFQELHEVVRTQRADDDLIRRRKEEHRAFEALTPPRVLTSDGEGVAGRYRRHDLPPGALVGLAVSAGVVEGRARVVHDVADADLETGDILVTAFTDPSWSPLFIQISGLVTEVGGQMTHGAVIAREYGLPAVVGVVDATRLIRDGQRIRVDGTHGAVELLPD
jgi:phosphoenolpyruvate synthase/pyruvate phosphate dikinase